MARGDGRIFQRNGIYWCAYYVNGTEHRESTKKIDEREAQKYLAKVIKQVHADQIGARTFVSPKSCRMKIRELVAALRLDYEHSGKLSPQNASELRRIDKDFGDTRAIQLPAERVQRYVHGRLVEGAKPATVNRLLTFLIRVYSLAVENRHLSEQDVPRIKLLQKVHNTRKGFCNRPEFDAIHSHLPVDLKDFALFGFLTGWRKGEISSLTWQNVHDGTIRLDDEDSKNGEGRSLVTAGELAQLMERRQAARMAGNVLSSFVFHRNGGPVKRFQKAWASACRKAGCPERLFHDLRRSAVRNLIRSGVPQFVAMSISGHKTVSMFKRYAITSEDDLKAAMEAVARYNQQQVSNVLSIGR
jgi:integrase